MKQLEDYLEAYCKAGRDQKKILLGAFKKAVSNIKIVRFTAKVHKGGVKETINGSLTVSTLVDIEWQIECAIISEDQSYIVETIKIET